MNIRLDDLNEMLQIGDVEFPAGSDGIFDVRAAALDGADLADLPGGVSIALCDRVIRSKELYRRNPNCTFEHSADGQFWAHADAVLIPPGDGATEESKQKFLKDELAFGKRSLEPLLADGSVRHVTESLHHDIAFLTFSLRLFDQPIPEAESRVFDEFERPLLFVCHASEDKSFVDRLVDELDKRALHAWYNKREILVGDCIVDSINAGLASARFVLVVLSPNSVN